MLSSMVVELDDRALMLRYRESDVTAFETLYQRHRVPLYRFLLNQSRDIQAAEDIFQEVWSRIIRSRDRYRPAAKFATYMYHIARNCFLDHVRRSGRQPVLVSIDDDPPEELLASSDNPEAAAETSNARTYLQAALDRLPPEQREAFPASRRSRINAGRDRKCHRRRPGNGQEPFALCDCKTQKQSAG